MTFLQFCFVDADIVNKSSLSASDIRSLIKVLVKISHSLVLSASFSQTHRPNLPMLGLFSDSTSRQHNKIDINLVIIHQGQSIHRVGKHCIDFTDNQKYLCAQYHIYGQC